MNQREKGLKTSVCEAFIPWGSRVAEMSTTAGVSDGGTVPGGRVAVIGFRLHRWRRVFNNYRLTAAVVLIP